MKLISVNVGQPRDVEWKGATVTTSIFKSAVEGPVALRANNLEGDKQADLSVHGGPTKAVYAYCAEHYEYWRKELDIAELPYGSFGENFTVEGLNEESVFIGNRYRVGTTELVVTEPRMPCSKLTVKFERADMVKRFMKSLRPGFYFGIGKEGQVESGDDIELLSSHPDRLSILDVTRLYSTERGNRDLLKKAIAVKELPESWRSYFEHQLGNIKS
jgi:MOSC domain-containing protein YiiM